LCPKPAIVRRVVVTAFRPLKPSAPLAWRPGVSSSSIARMKRAWQEAAERGDAGALRGMIGEGADVDSLDRYGQTALMLAARRGHLDVVRALIEAGADLDRTAKYTLSALMLATINDHHAVAELLVNAGADREIRGSGAPGFAGKTALDLAEDLGRESLAALLGGRG
jgi:ankyrin repeat protein